MSKKSRYLADLLLKLIDEKDTMLRFIEQSDKDSEDLIKSLKIFVIRFVAKISLLIITKILSRLSE